MMRVRPEIRFYKILNNRFLNDLTMLNAKHFLP